MSDGAHEAEHARLKIFVLGATGLIGSAVCDRLLAAGHEVTGFGNAVPTPGRFPGMQWCSGDFARRLRPRHWRSELPGVDVVINCIGIFHEGGTQNFSALHHEAPAALWEACTQYGVKRVIHLSALGANLDAPTAYWRTKAQGDAALLAAVGLAAWVVRPSLIYADTGASASLFRQLAALPLIPLPDAGCVQPIHLDDLANMLVHLATSPVPEPSGVLRAVGPSALRWKDYLLALRRGMGMPAAPVLPVPQWLARGLAILRGGRGLLSRASLAMLSRDNIGERDDAPALAAMLGHPLRKPETFATPARKAESVLATTLPLLRFSVAAVWLITALVSLLKAPLGLQLLADLGLPEALRWPALAAGIAIDAIFGMLSLCCPSRRLWLAQGGLVLGYTLIISIGLPEWWLHPFGPISKNLPILAVLTLCAAVEE